MMTTRARAMLQATWPAWLLFVLFALIYTATLSDGADLGKSQDSRTLLTAARDIAPPYTTGYPLYMLLAVLGLRLPAPGGESSMAFYASALPVALAVVFLYFAARRASGSALAAFLAAVLFGVFHGTWLLGTSVYTYGLALCMQWALYSAALRYLDSPAPRNALLVVLAFGLGCAVHPLNLLLALPCVGLLWFAVRTHPLPGRTWLAAGGILILCAALYLYLPITSPRAPWRGDLRSVSGLFHYLTGEGRGDEFRWSDFRMASALLGKSLFKWTLAPWVFLAALGALGHFLRNRRAAIFTGASAATLILFIPGYYGFGHAWLYLPLLWGLACFWVAVLCGISATRVRLWKPSPRGMHFAPHAAFALLLAWQLTSYGALDGRVRALRATSPVIAGVERAMAELARAPSPKRFVTTSSLLPQMQVVTNGEGLRYPDGGLIRDDWQLYMVQPGETHLPANVPTCLLLTREAVEVRDASRQQYFSGAWKVRMREGWTRTWIEFGGPDDPNPFRILGVWMRREGPRRVRLRMVVHSGGFHKPPERVEIRVESSTGEMLGESRAPLNHLGEPLAAFLHYEEFVDEREVELAREADELWVEPVMERGKWGRLPVLRVELVQRGRADSP